MQENQSSAETRSLPENRSLPEGQALQKNQDLTEKDNLSKKTGLTDKPEPPKKPDSGNRLMQALLEMGEQLLDSGAEVSRVEDTIKRLGIAYGAAKMNVFVIISNIIITMERPDGTLLTHTRRVSFDGSTNFAALEQLNELSRECCRQPLPLDELSRRIRACHPGKSRKRLYLGGIVTAASFALFFGGSPADGAAAAVFAVLICILQEKLTDFFDNPLMFNLLCSFVTGLAICLAARVCPFLHLDKVMIGDIMLLISGIAIANSIRDMLMGDIISGLMRLIEGILWAGALASGFMSAMWIPGIREAADTTLSLYQGAAKVILELASAVCGTLGYAILFGLRRRLWPQVCLGSFLCWGTYLLAMQSTGNIFLSGLLASILTAVYSEVLAIRKKAPSTLFVIPSVMSLIPGSSLYYMMSAAVRGLGEEAAHYGSLTLQYAMAIAVGISVVGFLFSLFRRAKTDFDR